MKTLIIENLDSAEGLELLYNQNKKAFRVAFEEIYPHYKEHGLMNYWFVRLNHKRGVNYFADSNLVWALFWTALVGVFLVKIPYIFSIELEHFYTRNIGFVVAVPLALFFAYKFKMPKTPLIGLALLYAASVFYINYLPASNSSDTLTLACMHLVLMLGTSLAFLYGERALALWERRMEYLKFIGDLIVICNILILAGGVLSAITIGLFQVIDIKIDEFYFEHIAPVGLSLIPLLGAYLIQVNPALVDKVSPLIARIFSPLVLVMLMVYLFAMGFSEKNLYTDRDFLLIFNVLLIGVMAIIFFALSESYKNGASKMQIWILFLLAILTIVVNSFALSAILFRISNYGFTPNRLAVLGSNVLMLLNLLALSWNMFKAIKGEPNQKGIAWVVAQFIPLYFAWAIIVMYVFPILFKYR